MPTGPLHWKTVLITTYDNGEQEEETEPCRCIIGHDHNADDVVYEYPEAESLSAYDAAPHLGIQRHGRGLYIRLFRRRTTRRDVTEPSHRRFCRTTITMRRK